MGLSFDENVEIIHEDKKGKADVEMGELKKTEVLEEKTCEENEILDEDKTKVSENKVEEKKLNKSEEKVVEKKENEEKKDSNNEEKKIDEEQKEIVRKKKKKRGGAGKKRKRSQEEFSSRLQKKLKSGLSEKLARQEKLKKRKGIVFMSYVPPLLSPNALREYVEKWGDIGRIYMKPEDESIARRRKKFKKDSRRRYVSGWIEFLDKRVAKLFIIECNAQPMGGKRKSRFYHDLWSIKYLKGFKWTHLKEEISHQKTLMEKRRVEELATAKRETKYVQSKTAQANHLMQKLAKEGKTFNDLKSKRKPQKQIAGVASEKMSTKDLAKSLGQQE